ncbi:unnamed protein product [Protopolystoma xenopodis]|uniref:Uncharacterized protein n=1 Tax=Protopolystoma xenopodis TaxID=117903 RepID=A0A3S4ZWL3_9PLAT|nr:unnamed protein product [Protopolystoma xenopodis]
MVRENGLTSATFTDFNSYSDILPEQQIDSFGYPRQHDGWDTRVVFTETEVLDVLWQAMTSSLSTPLTKQMLLNSIMKLSTRFSSVHLP